MKKSRLNKINNTLELGTFKVNDTNNVYLHYVAYFTNGAITKESFDKLLYDAIEKIDSYKEKLDNLSHGDVEAIFEKLNLLEEEETDEDASYSNVPMGRMRSKKPGMNFFSKPFLFNDEDDEKEDQENKREMIKELWHELMDRKSVSEMKQEIEEELEKSSSMETKEKGEDEKEDDFDIDGWLADFDLASDKSDTSSEEQIEETDEKPSERPSLFETPFDIDFDSLFEPSSDSNKKNEESNEVIMRNRGTNLKNRSLQILQMT